MYMLSLSAPQALSYPYRRTRKVIGGGTLESSKRRVRHLIVISVSGLLYMSGLAFTTYFEVVLCNLSCGCLSYPILIMTLNKSF